MKSNRFVLTGSIASGKSAVSSILKRDGFFIVDADEISRNLTAKGGKMLPLLREKFGDEIFIGEELDRSALSDIVFRDSKKRDELNSIMHPVIIGEMISIGDRKEGTVIFDIPLFFEIREDYNLSDFFSGVIVVDVLKSTQLQRLKKRDKINEKVAIHKINAQIPREEKLAMADYVINNDGSPKELEFEVEKLEKWLLTYEE